MFFIYKQNRELTKHSKYNEYCKYLSILLISLQFVNNNLEKDCCIKAITALLQGYTVQILQF